MGEHFFAMVFWSFGFFCLGVTQELVVNSSQEPRMNEGFYNVYTVIEAYSKTSEVFSGALREVMLARNVTDGVNNGRFASRFLIRYCKRLAYVLSRRRQRSD